MWAHARLHTHAGIAANYHHWAWGGWSSQEAGTFGAPAGHYQFQVIVVQKYIVATIVVTHFQVFAFAFAIMQRMEQSVSIRYRYSATRQFQKISACKTLNHRIKP
jgi:hypothetical protein